MTTTAASSSSTSATSSSPIDDSPTLQDNDGPSSEAVTSDIDSQPGHQQTNDEQTKKSDDLPHEELEDQMPCDSENDQEESRHSTDATVPTNSTSSAATVANSPTASSSFSQSSTSTQNNVNISCADVKLELSPPNQNQSSNTNSSSSNNIATEQKRPMNAFLLFCKKQRSQVREKYPNLENREITRILGDWWTKLDKEQKSKYTDMARQHKEAFMKANPDFKWCKTPNVSSLNNNISNNAASSNANCTNNQISELKHQQQNHITNHYLQQQQKLQFPQNNILYDHDHLKQNHHLSSTPNVELLSLQSSVHNHFDVMNHHSSNSMDTSLTDRKLGAPKPPKKRFLERNDSIYTLKDNNPSSSRNDTSLHGADIVPCISLDQDTLDRVIDKAFSEESNSKPSGTNNTCKCSNRNPTNLTVALSNSGNDPSPFSITTTTTTATTTNSSAYAMNIDEPVDFSMNRTINTTRQQIINNLVEKMLSKPSDDATNSFSRLNGTDTSLKNYSGPPMKKDKPDST